MGGPTSVSARTYSDSLSKLLKVPINLVQREGGTGVQGTTYVVNARKNGYVLLHSTDTPLVVMPVISKDVNYN